MQSGPASAFPRRRSGRSPHHGKGKLEDVTTRKKDVSALGLFDMAGNAAEWTATKSGDNYVVRGGSADKTSEPRNTRTSRRSFLDPNTKSNFLGFRCAKDVR